MNSRLEVLHLEDSPPDREYIRCELEKEGILCNLTIAENGPQFEEALKKARFDLILSDYTVPGYGGLIALGKARASHPDVPFILVSGTLGEEQAVDSLLAGATDYILKNRLSRLGPAVRRALKEADALVRRRQAEEALRTTQERFQVAMKNSSIMVFNQDRNLRYTWVYNPQFGGGREDILGKTDGELLSPQDGVRLAELKRRVIESGVGLLEEVQIRMDGRLRYFALTAEPMRDAAGTVVGLTGALLDVTAKKEDEARHLRAQRLESIGALASGVAHDLNNILAPVMMSAPMLRWGLTSEEFEKTLSTIETSARRGADLIKQLLLFGRGVEGQRAALDPQHLINEVMKMAGETFPKSITLRSVIGGGLRQIRADATQFHQVLLNLFVNARDAMPHGGVLTVAAENISLDECQAKAFPDAKSGDYVVVRVSDTGTGISPENLTKIFDPFFTTKEAGKGTGLGLSTVLGIVKSHGGFVDVKSEWGKGTSFMAYFPSLPSRQPAAVESSPVVMRRGHGELILVVDDEPQILTVTKEGLEKNGYSAMVAEDGVAAMVSFTRYRDEIAVVLTDLEMPLMDGVTLVRALKKINSRVSVIVCSGIGSEQLEKQAVLQELGVQSFLHKPYSLPTLLNALHAALKASARSTDSSSSGSRDLLLGI